MEKIIRRRSDKKINAEPGYKILQDPVVKLRNILIKSMGLGKPINRKSYAPT